MNISVEIIVAAGINNAIGKNNDLLWQMPADMCFFKRKTTPYAVLMGRKTYMSIPCKFRPLVGRENIVLTRSATHWGSEIGGVICVSSLDEGIQKAKDLGHSKIFIAGGGEVYRQAITKANVIWLTRIHRAFDADTFFPNINNQNWVCTEHQTIIKDSKNPYDYSFVAYKRKEKGN